MDNNLDFVCIGDTALRQHLDTQNALATPPWWRRVQCALLNHVWEELARSVVYPHGLTMHQSQCARCQLLRNAYVVFSMPMAPAQPQRAVNVRNN